MDCHRKRDRAGGTKFSANGLCVVCPNIRRLIANPVAAVADKKFSANLTQAHLRFLWGDVVIRQQCTIPATLRHWGMVGNAGMRPLQSGDAQLLCRWRMVGLGAGMPLT